MGEFVKLKYFFKKIPLDTKESNGYLSGFNKRNKQCEHLGTEELNITILWLKPSIKDIVFISIDTLYIPVQVSIPIYEYLEENFQITSDQIIFNATHTHSSPGIEESFDKDMVDMKYTSHICESILKVFKDDMINFTEGNIFFQSQKISNKLLISRRKIGRDIKSFFLKRRMLMLPNHTNIIDDDLRLSYIFDIDNNLKVVLYMFSCHPVFNTSNNVSSDFIGDISQKIKEKLNSDSMFLQGFLGDIRPAFTTKNIFDTNIINKFKLLFNQEVFRDFRKKDFDFFCLSLSQDIISTYNNIKQNPINSIEQIKTLKKNYTLISNSGKSKKEFDIKFILINHNLFISIPAEVTSRYKIELSKKFLGLNIIPLGLSDGVIGYLPFYDEISSGGYEVDSAVNYGWDTFMSENSLKDFYIKLIEDIDLFILGENDDNKK